MMQAPHIAIIDTNTLAMMGMKSILHQVMPTLEIDCFGSFGELSANAPEHYFHYFVSLEIMLGHRAFFVAHRHKTIVLTLSTESYSQVSEFHSLCVNVPEKHLVKALLAMVQQAHAHGKNIPPQHIQQAIPSPSVQLTRREIDVMVLIVQGCINKEIADKLNIGLTTVVTHRKNVMEKLGIKSVSALTIYAVTHGYVDINSI